MEGAYHSTLRAYSTNCFTTSQFISGSPPKKSISRLVRPPYFSIIADTISSAV